MALLNRNIDNKNFNKQKDLKFYIALMTMYCFLTLIGNTSTAFSTHGTNVYSTIQRKLNKLLRIDES